ncbi:MULTISPECIES: hypothetical protein [Marinobacter]|uniref:hypothetical protein n=1 Tax=Marinobacter TaxID=2742 RepID=UPI000A6EFB32|nr:MULTISPECIES: hypothetical protein [unclassified Marinobacter]
MSGYTKDQISQALFEADPMNTCCKENDCIDEYDGIAEAISARLLKGDNLEQAMIAEISEWFFDDGRFDVDRLKPVLELIREGDK